MAAEGGPRSILVAGGASGIGRAVALRLARDGFSVGVLDIEALSTEAVADEIQCAGGSSLALRADVRVESQVEAAVSAIERQLGPLFALVNSAGVLHRASSLDVDLEGWKQVIEVNLTGAFICARVAARSMVARGQGGRIVNVASIHSQAPGRELAAYDASKGGIWMLTRSLALELGPHGVAVNAVGPGLVVQTGLGGGTDPEYLDQVVPAIPLGRAGVPKDVAGPISFLCSPDASYITGAMLFVDGGMLLTART